MSIFSRYIFRQAAGALALILFSLTGVVWISLALKQLKLITSQGQQAWLFFKMTLLALPNLMALIAPIALLIATIHTLNRLNSDSELIVMTAGGSTVWRFARPLLALALIVSVAVSFVNHYAMPWSLRQLRGYITQVRTDLISQVLQPGKFNAPEGHLTIHIRARDRNGDLLGILMHDERKGKEITSYLAERGRMAKDENGTYLLMSNGHILRRELGKPTRVIVFERFPLDLSRMGKREPVIRLRSRERYYSELVNPAGREKMDKRVLGKFRSELHERFASPLYPFTFVLIAIAFIGQAQTTRQNRTRAVVLAFVCAAGSRLSGLASINLITVTPTAIPLAYIIPIGAATAAVIMAHMNMRPRRSSRLSRAVSLFFDRIGGWFSSLRGGKPGANATNVQTAAEQAGNAGSTGTTGQQVQRS